MSMLHRRSVLAGVAGVAVIGFDPVRRSWVTEAEAKCKNAPLPIPGLDGQLVTDAASIQEASQDFGYIIQRTPFAVLRPGSYQDIVKMVRYAGRNCIKIAGRGEAHSTYGQAQATGGIIIDMRLLNDVGTPTLGGIWVEAGATWRAVRDATLPAGLTPPVFTDYLDTTVGGTLCVGGIGGATHRHGLQIDNVLALEVVTGDGRRMTCSPTQNPQLFRSVLGGLGQFAIILRARLKLIPAKTQARIYRIIYPDAASFVAAQTTCALDERFSYLEGQMVPDGSGGWLYLLEGAAYYNPDAPPNDAALLAGLAPGATIEEFTYSDWLSRLDPTVAFLQSVGAWTLPHPWYDVFLPGSEAASYVSTTAAGLTAENTGNGPILFYAYRRSKLTMPFFQSPCEEVNFLFDILRFAPPVPAIVQQRIDENVALFQQARDLGGKRYPISSIPFSQSDWIQHFGADWFAFVFQKHRFDRDNVLTPGHGIFGTP